MIFSNLMYIIQHNIVLLIKLRINEFAFLLLRFELTEISRFSLLFFLNVLGIQKKQ